MPHNIKEEPGCSSDTTAALSEDAAWHAMQCVGRIACQVPNCKAPLSKLRHYYQRYKICEVHLKVRLRAWQLSHWQQLHSEHNIRRPSRLIATHRFARAAGRPGGH